MEHRVHLTFPVSVNVAMVSVVPIPFSTSPEPDSPTSSACDVVDVCTLAQAKEFTTHAGPGLSAPQT